MVGSFIVSRLTRVFLPRRAYSRKGYYYPQAKNQAISIIRTPAQPRMPHMPRTVVHGKPQG
jgi:hypothetical protein